MSIIVTAQADHFRETGELYFPDIRYKGADGELKHGFRIDGTFTFEDIGALLPAMMAADKDYQPAYKNALAPHPRGIAMAKQIFAQFERLITENDIKATMLPLSGEWPDRNDYLRGAREIWDDNGEEDGDGTFIKFAAVCRCGKKFPNFTIEELAPLLQWCANRGIASITVQEIEPIIYHQRHNPRSRALEVLTHVFDGVERLALPVDRARSLRVSILSRLTRDPDSAVRILNATI
ncbi:MAG: hypothetical protein WAQ31_00165 [Arcanobacterium sp.]